MWHVFPKERIVFTNGDDVKGIGLAGIEWNTNCIEEFVIYKKSTDKIEHLFCTFWFLLFIMPKLPPDNPYNHLLKNLCLLLFLAPY